jgi:septal ring factor EnvC (AmiA/AmiB activator)
MWFDSVYVVCVCTQTALDLLSSAAMTRVNGGGDQGTVAGGTAGDHREVGILSLVLILHDTAQLQIDMKKSVFCA